MKTILFSILVLGACGSSKPTPTPAPTETAVTPTEGTAQTEPPPAESQPTPPAEEKPVEPAPPSPEMLKQQALDAELAAFEAAKPVFVAACRSCHEKGQKNANKKKLEEFDMTAYPFTGEHTSAKEIRKVLAIGGGKATMPKGKVGSVKGDQLALIAAWADAWDAAEQAGAHAK